MTVMLAVFCSRTQTMVFVERMRGYGVQCSITQTPPEARVGCGVSARFRACDLAIARRVVARNSFNGFVGFFEWKKIAGQTIVTKVGSSSSMGRYF